MAENNFQRFFAVDFDRTLQVNPHDLINSFEELIEEPPITIVNNGKTAFTVKCASKTRANKISSPNNVGNLPCKTSLHSRFSTSKGLIFLTEFDIDDLKQFREELYEHNNISGIESADLINTRSEKTEAFVITFDQIKLP